MTIVFTERQQEIVSEMLDGKTNKAIALRLGITERTVEFHLSNIFKKLGVSTRLEAILFI